ncbi:CLUMA_CG019354, isoform A [Clunio marinus]|uniref:CLUMA_CG019354, isoform A n=1 Tax=Clunio marinus TaxID=568069 RepID=A0A1J1J0P6_9DIPT|nr:CLUMA_CG019354, isoform A [Clunio marinus]
MIRDEATYERVKVKGFIGKCVLLDTFVLILRLRQKKTYEREEKDFRPRFALTLHNHSYNSTLIKLIKFKSWTRSTLKYFEES